MEKVAKGTQREAARAWVRQRVVARVKEADSKEIATIVANPGIRPGTVGKEKVKEVDRWVTLSQRPSGCKEYHPG